MFCANTVKKDPARARQKSLATAGTNFTKHGAQNKGNLCSSTHLKQENFQNLNAQGTSMREKRRQFRDAFDLLHDNLTDRISALPPCLNIAKFVRDTIR